MAAIDLRKDQYIIKDSYYKPTTLITSPQSKFPIPIDGSVTVDNNFQCVSSGITFADPQVISIILCNYVKLKNAAEGNFDHDIWALMFDFDPLVERALAPFPMYEKIVECKIDNLSNLEIQKILRDEFNINHTVEYISTLWRNKIPTLIAAQAEEEYLFWYFETSKENNIPWKVCTRCGQKKPATEKFFSRNTGTKSGFYSICKKCRNEAYKAKKEKVK
jgi:superfamily II helicase